MTANIEEMLKDENAAWNSHDVDKIAAFYTDDCIKEDVAVGAATRGKEEMKALLRRAFMAIPDMTIELKVLFHSGNWAASERVMSGTYSRNFPGMPPATGKRFSVQGASIMQLRNGKISRIADYWNFASFLQQVGSRPGGPQNQ
jgi:steroid delta-isomerase-like uncharacterized protein